MLVQGIGAAVTVVRVHMGQNKYPLLLQKQITYIMYYCRNILTHIKKEKNYH